MEQYLLSMYQPDGPPPPPDQLDKIMSELGAIRDEMKSAGVWVFSAGLFPPGTATVIRDREGEVMMTDGPYFEGKEHLGGFSIVKAPDRNAALEWARRIARASTLPIEVRQFQGEVSEDG
jgi:hypothetical protein